MPKQRRKKNDVHIDTLKKIDRARAECRSLSNMFKKFLREKTTKVLKNKVIRIDNSVDELLVDLFDVHFEIQEISDKLNKKK